MNYKPTEHALLSYGTTCKAYINLNPRQIWELVREGSSSVCLKKRGLTINLLKEDFRKYFKEA